MKSFRVPIVFDERIGSDEIFINPNAVKAIVGDRVIVVRYPVVSKENICKFIVGGYRNDIDGVCARWEDVRLLGIDPMPDVVTVNVLEKEDYSKILLSNVTKMHDEYDTVRDFDAASMYPKTFKSTTIVAGETVGIYHNDRTIGYVKMISRGHFHICSRTIIGEPDDRWFGCFPRFEDAQLYLVAHHDGTLDAVPIPRLTKTACVVNR